MKGGRLPKDGLPPWTSMGPRHLCPSGASFSIRNTENCYRCFYKIYEVFFLRVVITKRINVTYEDTCCDLKNHFLSADFRRSENIFVGSRTGVLCPFSPATGAHRAVCVPPVVCGGTVKAGH